MTSTSLELKTPGALAPVEQKSAEETPAAHAAAERQRVVQVWDLPLRIFHWLLVVAIAAAYVTAQFGGSAWTQWHGRIGSFVLALLVFRVLWGFIGTEHARFVSFLPTPARIRAYLAGRWRGAGHNPLGALSVIALLLLVAAQVITGLFANDDITFSGPLADLVTKGTSDRLTGWHHELFDVLAALIGLHLLAIIFYWLIRGTNLVLPMLTGKKVLPEREPPRVTRHLTWRFLAAAIVAATMSWLTFRDSSSPQAETVAPTTTAPDW